MCFPFAIDVSQFLHCMHDLRLAPGYQIKISSKCSVWKLPSRAVPCTDPPCPMGLVCRPGFNGCREVPLLQRSKAKSIIKAFHTMIWHLKQLDFAAKVNSPMVL